MPELLDFQDAFVAALAGSPSALSPWLTPGEGQAGLAVYRNTIAKGCVDALSANFPTVLSMVGEDWFRAAAALFAREAPPTSGALLDYGEALPAWLERFPPAQDLPYLAGIAHLDRLWTEALFAAEASILTAETLAALPPDELARARLPLHPSVRFAAFEAGLPSLWLAAREGREDLDLSGSPETLLLVRRDGSVRSRVAGAAETEFLRACRAGQTSAEAAERAAAADPNVPLAPLFAALIADGVFGGLRLETDL
ncbi:HvfC/BufC N-terminal domain-containing protein [Caulobacter sp. RL271]|uniref:DNA-binding domain-containing protein n=1 Tax=Caulobacter segnis TaxID=88688 RepID=A0ABY4ZVY1_9CAUL|nr:DNA-binding domain-containing protein [Caulobacter segnis]USQ96860.1 DNA-binding domain-containing protein [Caulobacter segnis]